MKLRLSVLMLLVVGMQPLVGCKARRGAGSSLRGDPPGGAPQNGGGQLPGLVPIAQNRDWGIQTPANAQGQPGQITPVRALTYCLDRTIMAFPKLIQATNFAVQKINASGVVWTWAVVAPCNANVNLTVGTRNLGMIPGGMPVGGTIPLDTNEPYPYSPSPGGGAPGGGGNPNGGAAGTLAVFIPGGAIVPGQKFIEQGSIVFNNDPSVIWDDTIGSAAFDPIEVALHEFGHAMRLGHAPFEYNDDTVTSVTGSIPAAGVVAIGPGADGVLQTLAKGDDVTNNNNIDAGPDGTVDSGKLANLMEPFAVFGRHGVNPTGAITNNPMAQYNFSPQEIPSLINAATN